MFHVFKLIKYLNATIKKEKYVAWKNIVFLTYFQQRCFYSRNTNILHSFSNTYMFSEKRRVCQRKGTEEGARGKKFVSNFSSTTSDCDDVITGWRGAKHAAEILILILRAQVEVVQVIGSLLYCAVAAAYCI